MEQTLKTLKEKMADLRQFGIILLVAGVFFYLGVILPLPDKLPTFNEIMMITSIAFLSISIYLFNKAKNIKKEIEELEEE